MSSESTPKTYFRQLKEAAATVRALKILGDWEMERVEEYIDGLFSFAKFKEGDKVAMAKTYPVTKEESWGWLAYRHRLTEGKTAKVVSVDWCDGRFVYGVVFDDTSWIDDKGVVHPSDSEGGIFHLSERWFK